MRGGASKSSPTPLLFRADSAQLNRIAIVPCRQEPFSLIRERDRWILGYRGVHQPAEPGKARQLAHELTHIEVLGIAGSGPKAWRQYGLEEGKSLKVILHRQESREATLFFPCSTGATLTDTAFARLEEESEVFEIRTQVGPLLFQQPAQYRASLDLGIPLDLNACRQVRIHTPDSSWNLKSTESDPWVDWVSPDSLVNWAQKLHGLDLDAPYPFPEDPSPLWQMDFLLPETELKWVSFYRDTIRDMYYLETSSYSNLLFRIDSSLTYPSFLSGITFE
jgi:hypothetical protein